MVFAGNKATRQRGSKLFDLLCFYPLPLCLDGSLPLCLDGSLP
jgi:hypothetical protein